MSYLAFHMLANSVARMLEHMNSALCILRSKFQKKLPTSDKRLVTLSQVRSINEDVLNMERIFSIEAAYVETRLYAVVCTRRLVFKI